VGHSRLRVRSCSRRMVGLSVGSRTLARTRDGAALQSRLERRLKLANASAMVCEKFGPTFTAWRKNGGANRCGATRRKSMPTKTPAKKASPKDGKASGLQKPLQPSQELAAVIGSEHRSRGEVVSKV
jgi:chromatin remodeling complex protein RSC6